MIGESGTSGNGKTHRYYKCVNSKKHKKCDKKPIRKHDLEDLVIHNIMQLLFDDTLVNRIIDAVYDLQDKENTELPILQKQLAEIEKSINNMLNAIQDGIYTPSTKQRLEELEQTKNNIELSILQQQIEKPTLSKEQISYWVCKWRETDIDDWEQKQKLIDIFVNSIYCFEDKVVIMFNCEDGERTISLAEIETATCSTENEFGVPMEDSKRDVSEYKTGAEKIYSALEKRGIIAKIKNRWGKFTSWASETTGADFIVSVLCKHRKIVLIYIALAIIAFIPSFSPRPYNWFYALSDLSVLSTISIALVFIINKESKIIALKYILIVGFAVSILCAVSNLCQEICIITSNGFYFSDTFSKYITYLGIIISIFSLSIYISFLLILMFNIVSKSMGRFLFYSIIISFLWNIIDQTYYYIWQFFNTSPIDFGNWSESALPRLWHWRMVLDLFTTSLGFIRGILWTVITLIIALYLIKQIVEFCDGNNWKLFPYAYSVVTRGEANVRKKVKQGSSNTCKSNYRKP